MGFIETPYRPILDGKKVDFNNAPHYLSAEQEDSMIIAQANAKLTKIGEFATDRIKCRQHGDFPVLGPDEIDFMDISPNQIVGVSASLIPFLSHDDANRARLASSWAVSYTHLTLPTNREV